MGRWEVLRYTREQCTSGGHSTLHFPLASPALVKGHLKEEEQLIIVRRGGGVWTGAGSRPNSTAHKKRYMGTG